LNPLLLREEKLWPLQESMLSLASSAGEESIIGIFTMMVGNPKVLHSAMELLVVPKRILSPLVGGRRDGTPLGVHPKPLVGNNCRRACVTMPRIPCPKLRKSVMMLIKNKSTYNLFLNTNIH